MPTILVPVGLLAGNPWVVMFFVFVVLFCIMLYVREYVNKKFKPDRRGTILFFGWFLVSFVFLALLLVYMTVTLAIIFIDILLVPAIVLAALPRKEELPLLVKKKRHLASVLVGVVAAILVLYLSIGITNGFSRVTGTETGSGFEMRIINSEGVPVKIMGSAGIASCVSKVTSNNGNWGVYLYFTDSGVRAFEDAIIESGAAWIPDDHPIIIMVNNETLVSRTLTREYAEGVAERKMRGVTIQTGPGDTGKEAAEKIVASLAKC